MKVNKNLLFALSLVSSFSFAKGLEVEDVFYSKGWRAGEEFNIKNNLKALSFLNRVERCNPSSVVVAF